MTFCILNMGKSQKFTWKDFTEIMCILYSKVLGGDPYCKYSTDYLVCQVSDKFDKIGKCVYNKCRGRN